MNTGGARPRRLFAAELPEGGGEVLLSDESAQHVRVLRLSTSVRVELFDGRGHAAFGSLREVSTKRVTCESEPRRTLPEPQVRLHMIIGLPKGKKLDDAVRMLTELGTTSVRIALCERSVPQPREDKGRLARLQRIALEACAQSGQARTPELQGPVALLQAATAAPPDALRLVFYEAATEPLARAFGEGRAASEVYAVVGPEGGLSETEVSGLTRIGYRAVGLGPALLRVQTAVPVIAGLLLDRVGRLA